MTRKEIGHLYLNLLQNGNIEELISLFSIDGIVHSPIYGTKNAAAFYKELAANTSNSKLKLSGIFDESSSGRIAIFFNYQWTLKNGKVIDFDVVDILDFDENDKIKELRIIYDTVVSRNAIIELKRK